MDRSSPIQNPSVTAGTPRDPSSTFAILLDVMNSLTAERDLGRLLHKIMHKTLEVMDAERSTLFLLDEAKQELWSKVAEGVGTKEIRIPVGVGIAGLVARTGETVNIPDAYQDTRFNPDVDRSTGYHTRTILCMPLKSPEGRILGVLQVLNKRTGVLRARTRNCSTPWNRRRPSPCRTPC